jgi:hypothetical protein
VNHFRDFFFVDFFFFVEGSISGRLVDTPKTFATEGSDEVDHGPRDPVSQPAEGVGVSTHEEDISIRGAILLRTR